MDMVHAKVTKPDLAGLTPSEQLAQVEQKCHELIERQYSTLSRSLIPALRNEGYDLVINPDLLNEKQRSYLKTYFEETVYPVLTPTAVDASRPFPLIRNKSLNIGALISRRKGEGEKNSEGMTFIKNLQKNGEKIADKISKEKSLKKGTMFATVQVPTVLPRVVRIPEEEEGNMAGVLLEDLIGTDNEALTIGVTLLAPLESPREVSGFLGRRIMDSMEDLISANLDEKAVGKEIEDRVNRVADLARELAETLMRKVTPEELAHEGEVTIEEIQEAVRLSGGKIEDLDLKKQG
jgi:polyphosphate kinase